MGYSPWGRKESDTTEQLLFFFFIQKEEGFPDGSVVKNLPASAGGVKRCEFDPWIGKMPSRATHSSVLAWRIPCTEKPGGLQSMGLQSRTRLSD